MLNWQWGLKKVAEGTVVEQIVIGRKIVIEKSNISLDMKNEKRH